MARYQHYLNSHFRGYSIDHGNFVPEAIACRLRRAASWTSALRTNENKNSLDNEAVFAENAAR